MTNTRRVAKPETDELMTEFVGLMQKDPRSRHALSNVSGLATATLRNWENGKTRRPQGVSLQMAYKALGYKLRPVKE